MFSTMRRALYLSTLAALVVTGCGSPPNEGIVMSCFGVINQAVPGPDVFSNAVVTNSYFGGCSPLDPGMQIIERTTPAAAAGDPQALIDACDRDCARRLSAYRAIYPETSLPLTCQTLFAAPCPGLGADVSQQGATPAVFQAGGPADA